MSRAIKLRGVIDRPELDRNKNMRFRVHFTLHYEDGTTEEVHTQDHNYSPADYPDPQAVKAEIARAVAEIKKRILDHADQWNEYDTITGEENATEEEIE